MKTKTNPNMVKKIAKDWYGITHHAPTESNPLGQSGLHTLIDDIMDIAEGKAGENIWRAFHKFFENGEVELET